MYSANHLRASFLSTRIFFSFETSIPSNAAFATSSGWGKRIANALVLRRDVFDIASHECLLVLCAQRGQPCLEAEAGEELGWELLPHLFFWSVGREYDDIAVEVVHRAL